MPGNPMMKAYSIPMNKEMMEQVYDIARKRNDIIEKMMETNIPSWKLWLMKKNIKIGKLFGYVLQVKPEMPQQEEMIREKITLKKGKNTLDDFDFTVTQEEGPDLYSMLPKQAFPEENNDKPNYIG